MGSNVDLDFVVSFRLAVKLTIQSSESSREFPVSHTATNNSLNTRGSSLSEATASTCGGSGSPLSRYDSINAAAKLWRILSASADVSPHARQPGSPGISAKYLFSVSSLGSCITMGNRYSFT